jgi:hypothetical protein
MRLRSLSSQCAASHRTRAQCLSRAQSLADRRPPSCAELDPTDVALHRAPIPCCTVRRGQAAAESAEALTAALSVAAEKLIKVCSEHKMCVTAGICHRSPAMAFASAGAYPLGYDRPSLRPVIGVLAAGGWLARRLARNRAPMPFVRCVWLGRCLGWATL